MQYIARISTYWMEEITSLVLESGLPCMRDYPRNFDICLDTCFLSYLSEGYVYTIYIKDSRFVQKNPIVVHQCLMHCLPPGLMANSVKRNSSENRHVPRKFHSID